MEVIEKSPLETEEPCPHFGMWEKEEYIEKNLPRVKNFAKIGLNAQN